MIMHIPPLPLLWRCPVCCHGWWSLVPDCTTICPKLSWLWLLYWFPRKKNVLMLCKKYCCSLFPIQIRNAVLQERDSEQTNLPDQTFFDKNCSGNSIINTALVIFAAWTILLRKMIPFQIHRSCVSDPNWIRIQSGQWIRKGKNDPQK